MQGGADTGHSREDPLQEYCAVMLYAALSVAARHKPHRGVGWGVHGS